MTKTVKCPTCHIDLLDFYNELICGGCGYRVPITFFDDSEGDGESLGLNSKAAFNRHGLSFATSPISGPGPPKSPGSFTLTDSHGPSGPMKVNCPPEESAPGGQRLPKGSRPLSAEQCNSSSSSGCSQRPQPKFFPVFPPDEEIVHAIIYGLDLSCPQFQGGSKPCKLHPNLFTFCDGNLVSAGTLCSLRKEE